MKNYLKTWNILTSYNSRFIIFAIIFFTLTISLIEALGFIILSPFFSFLINFNNNFIIETDNFIVNKFTYFFSIDDKFDFLKFYLSFILIFYVFKFLFSFFFVIFNAKFIFNFRNKVHNKILNIFLYKNYNFFLEQDSSELVRYSSDEVRNYFNFVIIPSILLFAEIIVIFGLLIFAFVYSYTLFSIFCIFAFVCFIILNFFKVALKKIGKDRLSNEINRHRILQQIFFGIKDVIIFSKEKQLSIETLNFTRKISNSDSKHLIFESLPRHIIELITILILCFIIIILFNSSDFAFVEVFPQVAIYALIFFRILPSFTRISRGITSISYGRELEEKIIKFLSQSVSKRKIFSYDFKKELNIRQIEYKYPNSNKTIKYEDNISIKKGTFNCIIGKTGIGKTTFFDIICGLLKPNNAEIYLDDKKVEEFPLNLNIKTSIVHQNFFLFNDTLLKNITFSDINNIDISKVKKILKIVLLDDFVESLPEGLNTQIGEVGTKISGGQRQRIAIARALYQNPDLLLFDEALSGLDENTEKKLLLNLKNEFKDNITVIFIAHKISDKNYFDQIIELNDDNIKNTIKN